MRIFGRRQKGFSLVEMLIAMVIALVVIGGVYRTFTVQQKTFVVQEQVSEAQQSVRAVMDLIARDIRMAGFGRPPWAVDTLSEAVTITVGPQPTPNRVIKLELVGVFGGPIALLQNPATMGDQQIILNHNAVLDQNDNLLVFEQYYDSDPSGDPLSPPIPSIRYTNVVVWNGTGEEGSVTIDIDGDGSTGGQDGLEVDFRADADSDSNRKVYSQVYRVEAMEYEWTETTGELRRNGSVLAANVDNFQITDLNNGSYQVTIKVETRTNDPDFAGGHRERTLTSTIRARNLSVI